MTYFVRDNIGARGVLSTRRASINEFFLSSYTMSIYNGCEFGCPYCDGWSYSARPFNEVIGVPFDLPQRLAQEVAQIDRGDVVAITALSDPYQSAEQSYRLTRQVLQLFAETGQPCVVLTKSPTVLEDLSLLQQINERSMALVMTTLLTTDHTVATRLEGKASNPTLRLDMLSALKRAGIPVGVAVVPIIPYVNDTTYTLKKLFQACTDRGIDFVVWDYLHMPTRSHHTRIQEMLTHVGRYPNRYYQDIYQGQQLPTAGYRAERSGEILRLADSVGLEPHAPHKIYAGKIGTRNEAALLLKHAAFRNAMTGQERMATLHRELAGLVYRSEDTSDQLRASPLWKKVCPMLGYEL